MRMLRTLARSCAMFAANAAGSCNTSAAGTPIGNAPLRPVINIAERLKVTSLFSASAVARPLTRLSSTY